MKKNKTVVLGAAALCVGMLGFAGCNNQVMGKRDYVPATPGTAVAPMSEGPAVPADATPKALTPDSAAPAPASAPAAKSQSAYEPMKAVASAPVSSAPAGKSGGAATGAVRTHVVKSGDTLGHLARQYGVSAAAIMQANHFDEAKARRLQVGQKLTIPASGTAAVAGKAPAKGDKAAVDKAAKTAKTGDKAAAKGEAVKGGASADGTYTIQPGDFPERIAHKLGVKVSELMKVNNLTPETAKRLKVGQKITVPGKSAAGADAAGAQADKTASAAGTPAAPGNEQLDSVLNDSEVKAPTAGLATPQVVETKPVDTSAQLATDEAIPALNQVPVIIDEDTTVEAFAAKHNVTVDKLKELNPGTLPANGKLTKNLLLMVPGK